MQPVAHTTSRDFLAVSTGALEVLVKYLGCIRNAFLLIFLKTVNPLHYNAMIADLADTHNIDVFALTETLISPNTI